MRIIAVTALIAMLGVMGQGVSVSVNVFVQDGNIPVAGLKASDFALTDNGANQIIDSATVDRRSVDVTLLVDVNEAMPLTVDQLTRRIGSIARAFAIDDRIRVITFGADVALTVPLQPATRPLPVGRIADAGRSSLNAAILYALMRPAEPNRRHLVVASTTGRDTEQLLGTDQLSAVATRSDGVLVVLLTRPAYTSLGELIRATGGAIYSLNGDFAPAFDGILENFKGGYLVEWTPQRVKREGWHELKVTVPKFKKYTVRTRKGYMG